MSGPMLVTVDQAKAQLRIDTGDGDTNLALLIRAASRAVLRYLKTPDAYQDSAGDVIADSNGDPTEVPEDVQAAVIMLTGNFMRDPSGVRPEDWAAGYLPAPVISLLYPLRDPTLA